MTLLIRGGRVVDPSQGLDAQADALVRDGRVAHVGEAVADPPPEAEVIEAAGLVVAPGLVDLHVHFRQPGQQWKETIATGSRAAAAGGFTTVVCEPNTRPPVDAPKMLEGLRRLAARDALVRVYFKACITEGQRGQRVVAVQSLKLAGAAALSDDGEPVLDGAVMARALDEARAHDMVLTPHCEESPVSRQAAPAPEPYAREPELVSRDVALAARHGGRIHFSHISTADSARLIAEAKRSGHAVTAEATPHHLTLSSEDAAADDANAKMIPPLRSKADVEAVRRALAEGVVDAVASDHAPHAPKEKALPYDDAPFGVIGLETSLGVVLTELVHSGLISLEQAIERMSAAPARILGLEAGTLAVGSRADIVVFDPAHEWTVEPDRFLSKSRNCPFAGRTLRGRAVTTIVGGGVVMREGAIQE